MLWAPWAVRLRPPPLDPTRLAASLSATLLMVNSRIKAPVAHRLLDSVAPWRTTTHYLRTLAHQRHWPETRTALIRLADHLHHYDVPINYQRRRSLDYTTLLPEETWIAICTDLDIRCGGSERLRLMRCHLYTTISGNPVDRAPWLRDTNEFRSAFSRFPLLLTPTLHTALEDNAATFLRDNGIDEPLTWHPPLDLVADLSLPGADPDRLPLAAIHRMVRHGQSLTAIAEHLNSTPPPPINVDPPPAPPPWSLRWPSNSPPLNCATFTNTSGCRCVRSPPAITPAGKSSPRWPAATASPCDHRYANPSCPPSIATGSTPNTFTTAGRFPNSPPKKT